MTKVLNQVSALDLAEDLIMGRVSSEHCLDVLRNQDSLKFALDIKFHMYMSQRRFQNIQKPEYERFFDSRIHNWKHYENSKKDRPSIV